MILIPCQWWTVSSGSSYLSLLLVILVALVILDLLVVRVGPAPSVASATDLPLQGAEVIDGLEHGRLANTHLSTNALQVRGLRLDPVRELLARGELFDVTEPTAIQAVAVDVLERGEDRAQLVRFLTTAISSWPPQQSLQRTRYIIAFALQTTA